MPDEAPPEWDHKNLTEHPHFAFGILALQALQLETHFPGFPPIV